jgi:hypothetical protein
MGFYECKFISPWVAEGTKIFMQIFFVVSFLSLFFFLYVVKVERDQFEDQVNLIVDNILSDLKTNAAKIIRSTTQRQDLGKKLEDLVKDWKIPHREFVKIEENNKILMTKTKKIVISFAVILLALVVSLFVLHFCLHLTRGFIENLIVLLFIGLTEFAFLTIVASRYIAADPNQVKYTILNSIEEYALKKALEEGQKTPKKPVIPVKPVRPIHPVHPVQPPSIPPGMYPLPITPDL